MSNQTEPQELKYLTLKRILGQYPNDGVVQGPALIISAGIHGNEPSGVLALKKVFKKLEEGQIPIHGQVTGVAGNLRALKESVRLIDKDLNRVCTLEHESKILNEEFLGFHESHEFAELIKVVEKKLKSNVFSHILFMDLHTTSSETTPFISVNKQEKSYNFAIQFPLPVVKGIEKYIPGHFDHYLTLKGHTGFTVEAGAHLSSKSIEYHEAMIWMMLDKAGMMDKDHLREFNYHKYKLEETFGGDGGYEVIHRHHIGEQEEFKMKPGYKNFSEIFKGEILATANGEEVTSPIDGRIYMPLYQSQGSDGFFIVKKCEE